MIMEKRILAIDLGGSKMLTAIVDVFRDSVGDISTVLKGIAKRPLTKNSGHDGVCRAIQSAVEETLSNTQVALEAIDCIGVTIPGVADPSRGYWIFAPFSGIRDFPIAKYLQERFQRPVFADNDVNACAWGEKIFGVCQSTNNFLWITVSNGIGGGLVLDGRIFPGMFMGAAEIGHFNIIENGPICGCGNNGCLEAVAAGPAISRTYQEFVAEAIKEQSKCQTGVFREWVEYIKSSNGLTSIKHLDFSHELSQAKNSTALIVAEEARKGNPLAKLIYCNVGKYIGRAASYAANLVNPEKIVIGGGVSGAFDLFYPSLLATFQRHLFKQVNKTISVEKTGLNYEAGLLGAAAIAFQHPYLK